MSVDQFDPKHPERGWHPAIPLPEPWLWRVWRFLRLMRSANCPGCGMLMVAPHGTLPDAEKKRGGYCSECHKERAAAADDAKSEDTV